MASISNNWCFCSLIMGTYIWQWTVQSVNNKLIINNIGCAVVLLIIQMRCNTIVSYNTFNIVSSDFEASKYPCNKDYRSLLNRVTSWNIFISTPAHTHSLLYSSSYVCSIYFPFMFYKDAQNIHFLLRLHRSTPLSRACI